MGFFDKLNKSKGGHIFLSHSHNDIKEVRKIRNRLEEDGFEPLCFYLKCLSEDDEITDLIKREIDAREWFVFVNSENARNSRWVTMEREYIARTNQKKIITVDLNNKKSIEDAIYKLAHNLRVFITYSGVQYPLAKRIMDKLEAREYLVYRPEDHSDGSSWWKPASHAIAEAARDGCVIALISQRSMRSLYVQEELLYARHLGGNLIGIQLDDSPLTPEYQAIFDKKPLYHLPDEPTDEALDELVDRIGQMIVKN